MVECKEICGSTSTICKVVKKEKEVMKKKERDMTTNCKIISFCSVGPALQSLGTFFFGYTTWCMRTTRSSSSSPFFAGLKSQISVPPLPNGNLRKNTEERIFENGVWWWNLPSELDSRSSFNAFYSLGPSFFSSGAKKQICPPAKAAIEAEAEATVASRSHCASGS